MTSLEEALLRHLKKQANELDYLDFICFMVDGFIAKNQGTLAWACEVCELPADADFEQIYKRLRAWEK